jgi:flagellar protein FlaF
MGFSVSGAAAIIFAGMFIAFGMFYTATSDRFERVNEARDERVERALDQANTALEITDARYNATSDTVTVSVNNTGAATLSVDETDFLLDNDLRTDYLRQEVAGQTDTTVWLSGENYTVQFAAPSAPDRIKVVSGSGVADVTTEVA